MIKPHMFDTNGIIISLPIAPSPYPNMVSKQITLEINWHFLAIYEWAATLQLPHIFFQIHEQRIFMCTNMHSVENRELSVSFVQTSSTGGLPNGGDYFSVSLWFGNL